MFIATLGCVFFGVFCFFFGMFYGKKCSELDILGMNSHMVLETMRGFASNSLVGDFMML